MFVTLDHRQSKLVVFFFNVFKENSRLRDEFGVRKKYLERVKI